MANGYDSKFSSENYANSVKQALNLQSAVTCGGSSAFVNLDTVEGALAESHQSHSVRLMHLAALVPVI